MGMLVGNPVPVAADTADVAAVAASPTLRLMGFSVAESAGTPAVAEVVLRHGTSASDPLLVAPINLAADGWAMVEFSNGIACPAGIYVDRVGGNTTLVLYTCKA